MLNLKSLLAIVMGALIVSGIACDRSDRRPVGDPSSPGATNQAIPQTKKEQLGQVEDSLTKIAKERGTIPTAEDLSGNDYGGQFSPLDETAADSVMAQILADWKRRRTAIKTVRYVCEGTMTYPKGAFNHYEEIEGTGDMPAEDYTFDAKQIWAFDFRDKLVRNETHSQAVDLAAKQFIPSVSTTAYDGKFIRRIDPRELNSSDDYSPSDRQPEFYDEMTSGTVIHGAALPILFAHGYVPAMFQSDQSRYKYRIPDKEFFAIAETEHAGRKCIVVKTMPIRPKTFQEFWVDTGRSSIVLQWKRWLDGNLDFDGETEYRETKSGWFPNAFNVTIYWSDSGPAYPTDISRLQVKERAINPAFDADQFRLRPSPGMRVENVRTNTSFVFGKKAADTE